MKPRIAIIGAGISGLTLASNLSDHAEVTVFDKARGVGGRMSTRYAEPFYFDHGAQFFTARDPRFRAYLAPLLSQGIVAPWTGKLITLEAEKKVSDRLCFEPHYVAVPNMNQWCKFMAATLAVICGVEVAPLAEKSPDGWHVADINGAPLGVFDWVISTAPPVQTVRLFAKHLSAENILHNVPMLGCYTLMIGFNAPWEKSWIGAKIHNSPLDWIAINSSKPGRNRNITSIVAHSNNKWAEEHIDDAMELAELLLREEFKRLTNIDTRVADYFACHRWRYALLDKAQDRLPFMDTTLHIASVGDWCSASRIEEAWFNATQLAQKVVAQL